MPRNLDITALRSFTAVADEGKVTAAAARLNLTQSAVSMQLKRLEESLNQPLFDRSGRGIALTAEGELLLGYARRMIALNDEIWTRMTDEQFEERLNKAIANFDDRRAAEDALRKKRAAQAKAREEGATDGSG